MSTREDVHRLVDEVASNRLDEALALLRQLVEAEEQRPRRVFRSLGMGHAAPDLGARAKDIVRDELGGGKKTA
jgi:hypothetical protein